MKRAEVWQDIREAIEGMKIVDTHEHFYASFIPKNKYEMDLFFFLLAFGVTYLHGDLVSAGMKPKTSEIGIGKSSTDKEYAQKWRELEPHLENVRNTIYYRYGLIALRDLFGLEDEEIDDSNWVVISQKIRKKTKDRMKWCLDILDKMKVYRAILDISVLDGLPNTKIKKDDRLVQVARMDGFIHGSTQTVKNFTKRKVHLLDDYLSVLDDAFEKVVKAGAIGIKSGLAYQRIISYDKIAKCDAERIFIKMPKDQDFGFFAPPPTKEQKMFEDFMMHEICKRCAKHKLPFQIHTGMQAGNKNTITYAKPTHLTNLFQEYPDVQFDLFHGGYPYIQEAGLMAKYFPNVYLDACWLAQISPAAYKRGLNEWLEIVPANKIFAWGGDNFFIEYSYASFMLAKDLITDVLASKVNTGYFSEKVARSVANKILGENAIKVYGL